MNQPLNPPASSLDEEALLFHASGRPGKIEVRASKPLTTQRDLSLAYSPGVAAPCLRIAADPALAYDYTANGNLVAVISNGPAVPGLGDPGALASKPVIKEKKRSVGKEGGGSFYSRGSQSTKKKKQKKQK